MTGRPCQRPGCGNQIPARKRQDTRWCSRSCENKARRSARLLGIPVADYPVSGKLLPEGGPETTLTELDARRRAHQPAQDPGEDLREYTDWGELPEDHEDDPGEIYDEAATSWSDRYKVEQALDKLRARYEEMARPYLQQLRRNPGVKPQALVELETEFGRVQDEILRGYERAQALDRAARNEPGRRARAQEHQDGIRAMQDFSRDLGRGGRYQSGPESSSRATPDVFDFPDQANVFGSDREMYQRSGIARGLGQQVYAPDGWL